MDDDLLGGPPAKPFDDDLLGGPGPTSRAAFSDDMLFGPTPSASTIAPAQTQKPSSAPSRMPLKIAPVKEVAQTLVSFVNASTYFLRHLTQIQDDGARTTVIVGITDTALQFLLPDQTLIREIPVTNIITVISQSVVVARLVSKDLELQAVVQVTEGADVHFAFPKDEKNTDGALRDFVGVLTAVCASFNVSLPVSSLHHNEILSDHIARTPIDARLRRQVGEALAYRTELSNEASTLQRDDTKLELSIAAIRDSNEGHAVVDLVNEITQLEALISSFTMKTNDLRSMIEKAKSTLLEIQDGLRNEQRRREAAVRNSVEDAQKARLMKQVADFEIAKVAHKRELDRIAAVTSFYEQRSRNRADRYDVRTLNLYVDDLTEQLEEVQGRLTAKGEDHTKRVKALAENRRRMAQSNEVIAQLKQDINAIEAAPLKEDLPARLLSVDVPNLEPIVPTGTVSTAAPPPTKPSRSQAAAKVSVDDDDFDIPAPSTKPAAKKAISLDDEDDI